MEIVGQIIGGDYGEILVREKSGERIEIGELLVSDNLILQVYDLQYGSLLENSDISRMSGMELEGYGDMEIFEKEVRNYVIAKVKPIINKTTAKIPKHLPSFLGKLRKIEKDDLSFITKPQNPLYLGKVRSGSETIDVDVYVDGREALTHHMLIPATTGRGKSNLVKVMLWNLVEENYCGILVLDAHNEYYGINDKGLKDHSQSKNNVLYYSLKPPVGGYTLRINIKLLRPWHLKGIMDLTQAQEEAIYTFYNEFNENWIEEIMKAGKEVDEEYKINLNTLNVLKRKFRLAFNLDYVNGRVEDRGGIFSIGEGKTIIKDIVNALEDGKIVIIDTSILSEKTELILGGMITNMVFNNYRRYKEDGNLTEKPVISIVIEEAPRVLGEGKSNIFGTVAREGRKFQIGLIAITQLASMIPRDILANMNTKIILGNEMSAEREALIHSAAQDLSKEGKMIASLDKGEAIVTSIFTKFAIPIQIDLFDDICKTEKKKKERLVMDF